MGLAAGPAHSGNLGEHLDGFQNPKGSVFGRKRIELLDVVPVRNEIADGFVAPPDDDRGGSRSSFLPQLESHARTFS